MFVQPFSIFRAGLIDVTGLTGVALVKTPIFSSPLLPSSANVVWFDFDKGTQLGIVRLTLLVVLLYPGLLL